MVQQTQWRKLQILTAASGLSFLGSALTTFAVVLRDKDAAGAAGVSALFLCMLIPSVIFSPWAGLLADRYQTKLFLPPLMLVMSLCSFSLALDLPNWWAYIALFLSSTANTGVSAAFTALIPSLATRDDMSRVTGMQTTFNALGTMMAPALGGILVDRTGYFWPFIIDGISFLVLTATVMLLRVNRVGITEHEEGSLKALAGVKFVFGDPLIRAIVLLTAVLIVSLGVIQVGEVFLLIDELKATPLIYGLVGAIFALGAITGGVFTTLKKVPLKYHLRIVTVAILMIVIVVFTIARAHHWWVVMSFGYMGGVCMSLLNAYGIGFIQNRTEESVRARVMSTFNAIITVGSVTSTAIAGIAIAAFGVRNVFQAAAVLGLIILLIFGPAVLKAGKHYGKEELTK